MGNKKTKNGFNVSFDITIKEKNKDIKEAFLKKFKEIGIDLEKDLVEIIILEIPCNDNNDSDENPEVKNCRAYYSKKEYQKSLETDMKTLIFEKDKFKKEIFSKEKIEEFIKQPYSEESKIVTNYKKVSWIPASSGGNFFMGIVLIGEMQKYEKLMNFVLLQLLEVINKNGGIENLIKNKFEHEELVIFQDKGLLQRYYATMWLKENNLPSIDILTELSASFYEGSVTESRIYFSNNSLEVVAELDQDAKLQRELDTEKLVMVRKLMEISKRDKIYLYANTEEENGNSRFFITQLVRLSDDKKEKANEIYIKFTGFLSWQIIYEGKEEIGYYKGECRINYTECNKEYKQDFNKLTGIDKNMLENLIKILEKQKHGTSVIFMDEEAKKMVEGDKFKSEVDRLCNLNRGTKLGSLSICYDEHKGWDEEVLLGITSIDGALMMNFQGQCLAIGVIVDGEAKIPGKVSRGARYNSITNYVKQKRKGKNKCKCIGIIFSEDGRIDIQNNYC